MESAQLAPFVHSGDSANLAYYGENRPQSPSRVWCEVMRTDFDHSRGENGRMVATPRRLPRFSIRVYRGGREIHHFTYSPRSRPKPGALPARTVTRLVREALA